MPVHMPVKSRSQCSPYLLKQDFSLNLELASSAEFVSQQAPETLLSLPPSAGILHHAWFLMWELETKLRPSCMCSKRLTD